jgi:hypothetical protein
MDDQLRSAIAALERLTVRAIRQADDQTLRRFHYLTDHWHEIAASEHERRADARKVVK